MEYAKLLQQSAGRFDYRESPSKTVTKVNEIRNTIDKGGRQSLPRQQTYANKIQQHLSKEELKRKINNGAFRYKTAIQQEYDDLILSKLRNRKDDEYMKTANKQAEFMKLLGDTNKIEYLSKVDPFGLFMLRQQNEKNKIDFLDQNKQLDDYKKLRDSDPDRAKQMYEFSDNNLLKLFGNQPDIPSFDNGLSVPILSSYNPIPTRLPAPPAPIREPPPPPEPVKAPSLSEVIKTRNRFGALPIDDEDEIDSFSLPSATTTEAEPELDEGEEEIADEVAESLISENPDISESDASSEATEIVKEARKVAPVVEASMNPEEFEEQVEEEPLTVDLPLKKGKGKKDKLYNEILKSPELAELRQKLAKSKDMGIQEDFANLLADMDEMDFQELSQFKSAVIRANKETGNDEELEERGAVIPAKSSSEPSSKKGSKKEQRKQKRKQKQEQEQELELQVAPDIPISSAEATRREAVVSSIDPVQDSFDNLPPEIKAQFAKPSQEKLAKLMGFPAKEEAELAKKLAESSMLAPAEAQSPDDELQQAMEAYINAQTSKEKNKIKSELTKKFKLDKESIELLEQERRAKEDKDPSKVESAKESVSKIKPLLKAEDRFSKLDQHNLKYYKTDTLPHIATIKEASALSDEQITQLAEKYRINPLNSNGQRKAKSTLINELYNKNRLAGDGFSGKGFRRLHTYPKHVIAGALHIVRHRKRHLNRNEYNREQAYHLTQKAIHGGGFFGDLLNKINVWTFRNLNPIGRMITHFENQK